MGGRRSSIVDEAEEEADDESDRSLSEEAESGTKLDPEDVDEYTVQDLDRFSTEKDNRATFRFSDQLDARLQLAADREMLGSRQATIEYLLNKALRDMGIE